MSSGIVTMRRYPFTAATIARPMPVLPLVGSTMVSPGLIRPSRSAASIMLRAIRSLMLPAGLCDSTLATTSAAPSWTTRLSRTMGVPPIRSSTVSAICPSLFIPSLSDDVAGASRADRAVPLRQVGDCCVLQHAQDRLPDRLPHVPLGAATALRAGGGLVQAIDGDDGPLQGDDHLADEQRLRVADQGVAALRAAHAAYEAGAAQRGQQLLQVRLRYALPRGDLGALRRLRLAEVVRQLDEGADTVVAFGGNLHVRPSAGRKWSKLLNNRSMA